ncbi:ABC transporter substrate-binding protein [Bradyrhizobium sp. USDA 4486]
MRKLLRIAGLTAVVSILIKPAVAADQVTITSWGGAAQAAQRKVIFEPFAQTTGIKVVEDEYSGEIAKIRAMVESKTVNWDVINTQSSTALLLCREGMLERIDWKKVGLERSRFVGSDMNDCGVPDIISSTVFAYDKDKLPNGPRTIGDLFDTKKFPGKRGLWKNAYGNIEWALAADGVPFKDVYNVLRTPEGVDRAFRKLDTIKKDVIWWTSGAQPAQLLADGQVVMTSVWNNRIYDAIKTSGKNFGVVWDAQEWSVAFWTIPKGSPKLDSAYKYIAFAASPRTQGNLTHEMPWGASNRDAGPFVDPAMLPHLANSPEHMQTGLPIDPTFWAEKGDEVRQRFNNWLAR